MNEGINPYKEFNVHKGKTFYLMVIGLAVIFICYLVIYRRDQAMAIAVFAKWTLVLAMLMNLSVILIQIFGPQNLIRFNEDSFDLRFAQLQKMHNYKNSLLEYAGEERKNILTLKIKGIEKALYFGLFQIDPKRRSELVDLFMMIAENNKVKVQEEI